MACKRILFIGEGSSLAHVVRPKRLVEIMGNSGHELHFAFDSRYQGLIGRVPATVHSHRARPPEVLQRDMRRMRPLFPPAVLERYLAADFALIDRVRPDLVAFDLRPTVPIAAALRQIPAIAVINAYHSPFAERVPALPDTIYVRRFGVWLSRLIFGVAPGPFHALALGSVHRMRRRLGLPRTARRLFDLCRTDVMLHPDADDFAPTPDAPASHVRTGPLLWRPDPPSHSFPKHAFAGSRRPLAYVTSGSSGDTDLLPAVADGLVAAGANVLMASAGRDIPSGLAGRPRVRVVRFVDGDEACRRADIVVSNGGNPQLVQALAAGTPVLGLPSNYDQALNMAHADRLGASQALHPARVTAARVRRRIEAMLEESSWTEAAATEASRIAAIDVPTRVREAFARML